MDRRIQQYDAPQGVDVSLRPTEGDRAAPVVGDRDDRTGEPQDPRERVEISDPIGQPTPDARALGEPHVELVDGNHPDARRRLRDQVSPQVRPGRIPVNAEHGELSLGLR
ncbi:unannotated protein [freshwater metagenome]|uniref:Unannotated protein n=1 Tax=freshwater metagenome TaxID=449393 RepID=A0A6J7EZY0_9ZZZZ